MKQCEPLKEPLHVPERVPWQIQNGKLLQLRTGATFDDLMNIWPKEPIMRQEWPISIHQSQLSALDKAYRKAFSKKRKK